MRNKELPSVVKPESIPALSPEQRQIEDVLLSSLDENQLFLYLLKDKYPLLSDDLKPVFMETINFEMKKELKVLNDWMGREYKQLFFLYDGNKDELDEYELRYGRVTDNELSELVNVCTRQKSKSKYVINGGNPNLPILTENEQRFAKEISEKVFNGTSNTSRNLIEVWLKKLKFIKKLNEPDNFYHYYDMSKVNLVTPEQIVDDFLNSIPIKCKNGSGFNPCSVSYLVGGQLINPTTTPSGIADYRTIYEEEFGILRQFSEILGQNNLNERVDDFYKKYKV